MLMDSIKLPLHAEGPLQPNASAININGNQYETINNIH
jgi:hypothetical protein